MVLSPQSLAGAPPAKRRGRSRLVAGGIALVTVSLALIWLRWSVISREVTVTGSQWVTSDEDFRLAVSDNLTLPAHFAYRYPAEVGASQYVQIDAKLQFDDPGKLRYAQTVLINNPPKYWLGKTHVPKDEPFDQSVSITTTLAPESTLQPAPRQQHSIRKLITDQAAVMSWQFKPAIAQPEAALESVTFAPQIVDPDSPTSGQPDPSSYNINVRANFTDWLENAIRSSAALVTTLAAAIFGVVQILSALRPAAKKDQGPQ